VPSDLDTALEILHALKPDSGRHLKFTLRAGFGMTSRGSLRCESRVRMTALPKSTMRLVR
jgi:hypothetical protein